MALVNLAARVEPEKPEEDADGDETKKRRAIPSALVGQIMTQMIEETVRDTCFLRRVPGPVGTFDVHQFAIST